MSDTRPVQTMRPKHRYYMAAAIAVATQAAAAAAVTVPRTASACVVDSIDCRSELTRVYCRYTGRPHTSDRIDAVTLVTEERRLPGTDIDGVDFKRYFQWEEDGIINLEIDFAPVTGSDGRTWSLEFDTVRGPVTSDCTK